MKKFILFSVIFIFLAGLGWGQAVFTWTGLGGNNNWENPGNWDCDDDELDDSYPGENGSTDTVNFENSANVSISSSITIGNITVAADVVINIEDYSEAVIGDISSDDDHDITINVGDSCDVIIGDINTAGDVTITAVTGSAVTVNQINAGGSTDIDSNVTVTNPPPQNYVWSGATNSNWGTGTNWIGGTSPGNGNSTYTITIPNTSNTPMFTGATLTYDTLTIQAGASLNIGTANLPTGTLVNNGNLILAGGGSTTQTLNTTITVNETVTFNAATPTGANSTLLAGLTSFKNLTIENGARASVGNITVSGDFILTGGSLSGTSINVTGTSNIAANVTTSGTQTYTGTVTLSGAVGTKTLNAGTSTVTFEDEIIGGNNSLTITGNGIFNGAVSGINNLSVSLASDINVDIATNGTQTYSGAVTLGDNVTLTGTTVSLGVVDGDNHSLTIAGNGVLNGGSGINVLLVTGNFNLTGDELEAATINITGTSSIAKDITTAGNQTYTGAVTLGGDIAFTGVAGSTVYFGSTVNGTVSAINLTIANANVIFNGSTTTNIRNITVDTGNTTINANITTTGTQDYKAVTLGNTLTLAGTTVTFDGAITGGNNSLTITGNGTFNGAVSGINNLSVSLASVIKANITTNGTQTYTGNVTISDTLTLTGSTVTLGAVSGGSNPLTITGDGVFTGATNTIGDLLVSKNFSLTGASLNAASIIVTGTSSIAGNITTTGAQTYTGAVTLGGAVGTKILTGSTVTLGTITGNNNSLTITGDGVLNGGSGINALTVNGGVGVNFTLNNPLSSTSVNVSGTSNINDDITTTGTQTYTGTATLSGDKRTITSQNGDISFGNLNSSGKIELLATGTGGDITLGGTTTAEQLIAIASGVVKVNAIEIDLNTIGNEGTNAAIYIEANSFDASTAVAGSIKPGGTGGQLCLVLNTSWTSNGAVDGAENVRWHQHGVISLTGKHLVYGGTDPGTEISPPVIIPPLGNYVYVSDTSAQTTFVLDDDFNIYIYNASPSASSLTFETKGDGTINFIGTNTFVKVTFKSEAAGGINISSNVAATGTQTYSGTVILDGDRILTGSTVSLGAVTGGGHSLVITGNGELNGALTAVDNLSVSGTAAINVNIATNLTQTYGAVTLGGTGDRALTSPTVTLGVINGGGKSLTITGNSVFNGAVSGINNLSVTSASAINADITTNGTQTYGAATLGGTGAVRTLTGTTITLGAVTGNNNSLTITGDGVFNGKVEDITNLYVSGTASSTGVIELTATGNITIGGAANARRLIVKTAGTVSVNEIKATDTGNHGEDAAIYIEANTFVVTTTAQNSIIPGQRITSPWGQLCLDLQNRWTGPYDVVDGDEDTSDTPPTATGFRWHQHYPGSVAAGKILYSFTEDSNGNGRLDRIRAQTNRKLNGDFSDFDVRVDGYAVTGYAILSAPDDDSFYINLRERDELDGGNTPHWSIIRNTSLMDTTNAPMFDMSEIQYIDTIPPRIAYTLTLPGKPQTYVQMSEPVKPSTGSDIIASFGGSSTNISASRPNSTGYLFVHSVSYGVSALANLSNIYNDTTSTAGNGYFQMTNVTDNGTPPETNRTDPKYPANWGYTSYARSTGNNVFIPPHKLLTVAMMTSLANGQGSTITPSSNFTVTRRVTDVLVSIAPSAAGDKYFVWPVWVKPSGGSDTVTQFDGSAGIEKSSIEENGIELQARLSDKLTITGNTELFWTTANIPAEYRNPKEPSGNRKAGGLWLPDNVTTPLLYYYAPLSSGINKLPSSSSPPLYNYDIAANNIVIGNSAKFEFVFRLPDGSDMLIARLDGGNENAPNWYTLVRPFAFDIMSLRIQRGGVTVLNNVINSNNRETAFIRYNLTRPGRVTVQIYTLDGTLVKSLRRNEQRDTGEWTDTWDGTNNGGRAVARGMYFVRVVGPDIDEIRKIMVVK